jgi:hypothetical protein
LAGRNTSSVLNCECGLKSDSFLWVKCEAFLSLNEIVSTPQIKILEARIISTLIRGCFYAESFRVRWKSVWTRLTVNFWFTVR